MHCLLCHEKIPRLRVWRTKSEFCCEEHAALYKKQTLERLLVDPTANQNGVQASLPEPPEPEEFEFDEPEVEAAPIKQPKGEGAHDDFRFWERFDRTAEAKTESVELPPPADEHEGQGIDELWRLADEVGSEGRGVAFGGGDVSRQSAEEALEALRQLANRTAKGGSAEPEQPKVFEMPGPSNEEPLEPLYDLVDSDRYDDRTPATDEPIPSDRDSRPWEMPAAEVYTPPAHSGRSYPGEEPEDDSILERLMADPLDSWKREKEAPEAASIDDPVEVEAQQEMLSAGDPAEANEEPISSMEADVLDLGAPPDPNWDFEDASSELNALKASLAGSGAPAVAVDQGVDASKEIDFSPVEPDWEELEALELSDADIEPPEPELEDGMPLAEADKVLAFPLQPDPDDEQPQGHEAQAAAKETAPRSAPPRFRPVLELVELEPDLAGSATEGDLQVETEAQLIASDVDAQRYSMPGGPAAIGPRANSIRGRDAVLAADVPTAGQSSLATPRELRQPDDIAPPKGQFFLPTATGSTSGQVYDLSMHDGSVDIEPAAMLNAPDSNGYVPEGSGGPFEPAGLFFDMTSGGAPAGSDREADEQEADVAAAGQQRENR